jgi:hypothetical protein
MNEQEAKQIGFRMWLANLLLPAGYYIAKMPKRGVTRKPRKPKAAKITGDGFPADMNRPGKEATV